MKKFLLVLPALLALSSSLAAPVALGDDLGNQAKINQLKAALFGKADDVTKAVTYEGGRTPTDQPCKIELRETRFGVNVTVQWQVKGSDGKLASDSVGVRLSHSAKTTRGLTVATASSRTGARRISARGTTAYMDERTSSMSIEKLDVVYGVDTDLKPVSVHVEDNTTENYDNDNHPIFDAKENRVADCRF